MWDFLPPRTTFSDRVVAEGIEMYREHTQLMLLALIVIMRSQGRSGRQATRVGYKFYPRGMTSPSIRRIVQIECGFFFYLSVGRVSCGSCPAAKANKYISGVELHSERNCLAVSLGLLGHQQASLIYPGEVGLD